MDSASVSSLSSVYAQLTSFANLENFWSLFNTAFGSSYDFATAASFRSQWQGGNFSQFPQIEIVSSEVLGSANGAYAISTNKIYLSDQFVSAASQQSLDAVILEEFGHFVDAQVNQTDTAGDEGELFSDLVRGVELSPSELTRIQTENDHAVVKIGGQPIAIERALGTTGYIQFGTSDNDKASGISTDSSGNIYVTGYTQGSLPGYSNLDRYSDAFVAKYDASGNQLWITQFGSSDEDLATNISTDSSGNIYVAGYTLGNLPGYSNLGRNDAFVAKYDASGNQLWVKQFGSSSADEAYGISTDSGGNIYVTGYAFVAKYDASGNQLWIKQIGVRAYGISTDSNGNVYVTGDTGGSLPGNSNLGSDDAFIAKYDASGNQLWVKQFGSSNDDRATNISTDSSGNIYVTGYSDGSLPGNSNLGSDDAFIAKYDASGNQLWVKQFGSSEQDEAYGISTDSSGNIYVTGYTRGSLPGYSYLGFYDAFIVKYDASGNQLWVKQFGTYGGDFAVGISTDSNGHVYVTGTISGNLLGNISLGGEDAFVVGFDANGNLLNTSNPLPSITLAVSPNSVTEDGTNNLVYTFTRTGPTANALTVTYGITGTAGATDYTGATPGTGKTITFAANSVTATVTVNPTADTTIEANETVALTLVTGTGYTIGTATAVTGTITNDDFPEFTLESNGNTKLLKDSLNYLYTQNGSANPITIKYLNQPIYQGIFSGWQTIAAETINGQNQVLWKNVSTNSIIVWKTDSNWNYQTSDGVLSINSPQALNQEITFQINLNNDSNLGNVYSTLESQGTIKLVKDSLNNLYSQSGNLTPTSIKYLNQPIYQGIFSGWQTLAAETINGQNQVLWKNASTNSIIVWKTDSNWNYQTSDGVLSINSPQALNQEITFQIDLNNDSNLGNVYSTLESQGTIKLVKDSLNNLYSQSGNLTPTSIKYLNQPIYQGIFSGWQTLAAETINGQNQVLWKNASTNSIIVWKTDSNWNYQTSDGVLSINSLQALNQEIAFQIDLNNDTNLGNTYSNIESQGTIKLVKDSLNNLYSQSGNLTPTSIKYLNQSIYQGIFSGWQTLAAETINGQNQVLWKNASSNSIIVWKTDNNWNYQTSDGVLSINSLQALNQETTFQIDLNNDRKIGNPIVGTAGNDTLTGTSGDDQLTGGLGNDTLTGGVGRDRFVYQSLTDSLLANFDEITDFNATTDRFLVGSTRSGFNNVGTVTTLDNTGISAKLTAASFGANSAAQFTFGSRTFVAINDATGGFGQTTDAIIEITGLTGTLGLTNFVTV